MVIITDVFPGFPPSLTVYSPVILAACIFCASFPISAMVLSDRPFLGVSAPWRRDRDWNTSSQVVCYSVVEERSTLWGEQGWKVVLLNVGV